MKNRILCTAMMTCILFLSGCGSEKTTETTAAPTDTVSTTTTTPDTVTDTVAETVPPMPEEEPGTTVRYGTPVMDGVLDEIYEDSFAYSEEPMANMNYSASDRETAEKYMKNTRGTAYYLYDEDYLYVCTVVKDETICSRGEEWRMNTEWPWNDDGAEIYLWFSDEDCMAIHSDAHGIRSVVDEHIWGDNHSSAGTYHDLADEDWGASIDEETDQYTVEFRVPLPDYVKPGDNIGTLLEIDDRWAVGDGTENLVGALFVMPRFPGDERLQVKLSEIR